ncbi:PAS domain S-box protein [Seohaeicola saemankumensis]|nr:PAS domain-containing hybrid sensor histidine kinase/response regulator [Seohaeicola saemankumensis]MCA0869679.1 PAS domain S-box protein [Seohaeicola saemankumensis]
MNTSFAPIRIKHPLGPFLVSGLLAVLVLALAFSGQVIRDLERLKSAESDNLQWTLPQAEVEYMAYLYALNVRAPDGSTDLAELRKRYDILYSRIDTLSRASPFQDISVVSPAFGTALSALREHVLAAVPLIDGPDAELRAALPALGQQAEALRTEVRLMSVLGLSYFARQSDLRRLEVAATLQRLAIVTAVLLLALAALSVFLLLVNRQTHQRGLLLAQANQRMNTILSTTLEGIIVFSIHGRVLEFNPAAEAIFGLSETEARGRSITELVIPDHLMEAVSAGLDRLRSGAPRRLVGQGRVQLEARRSNGEVFPVELVLQSARDGEEEIFIAFVRDISQRIADEQELIEARDRALDGEKAKADVLTMMSHEIRTPLNGILGNLSLLEDSGLSEGQTQLVHNMEVSGRVLMSHVDAVLDIARFEAGKLALDTAPAHLGSLLQELIDSQSSLAGARGTRIGWSWVGAPLHWVLTDRIRLQQILLNLVGNAIKFTENGRIDIEVEVLPEICEDLPDCRYVEFRVSDTGVGIAEADIDRVFEDFQTSDPSFRRASGGSGLGLGIARRMTEAMQGYIGVESIPGQGSTFWVRLPLTPAAEPQTAGQQLPSDSDEPRLSVLVVEDNDINLRLIQSMLERDGHRVTCATDGRSGVQRAAEQAFDVILMDISMPVMDGLQATGEIRRGGGPSAGATIYAVSANVLPQEQDRFLAAGMDGFIGKPLTLPALRRSLLGIGHDGGKDGPPEPVEDVRADLLARFVEETDALIAGLGPVPPADGDLDSFARRCHKTAGSAAVFGARRLHQTLTALEQAARAKDRERLDRLLPELPRIWQDTRAGFAAGAAE